jgi:hypothetical protein
LYTSQEHTDTPPNPLYTTQDRFHTPPNPLYTPQDVTPSLVCNVEQAEQPNLLYDEIEPVNTLTLPRPQTRPRLAFIRNRQAISSNAASDVTHDYAELEVMDVLLSFKTVIRRLVESLSR